MRILSSAAKLMAAGALLAVAACATPTPYQPKDQSGYGFSENRIESNRYSLSFRGNSLTEREQVENALLYRAAELTLQSGYDHFVVVQRGTDAKSSLVADAPTYRSSLYFSYMYYHPRYGWAPWYDPFWADPPNYREITRYEASAEIVMGKGAKPANDPKAFNAREVEANLRGKIVRPAAPAR